MSVKSGLLSILILLIFGISVSAGQVVTRKLAFKDEFNGSAGSGIDTTKWTAETGGQGWGNQELQYYTNSASNAYLNGAGSLIIKVDKLQAPLTLSCWYGPCQYTSARLITKQKFDRTHGRFEARIRIPRGKGIWPAFWMLGSDIDTVGWPQSGEIDILENIGREPTTVHGTIHGPGYSGAQGIGAAYSFENNAVFADGFHEYAVEWTENKIRWYVDGHLFQTLTPQNLPTGSSWVFEHPFFMILNVAVGGPWGGPPDETTVFPQEMEIDYVRVYHRS